MAYNFKPLKYSPYKYTPQHRYTGQDEGAGYSPPILINNSAYDPRSASETRFQDYSGDQFRSLFDAINTLGTNPYMSGAAFGGAPKYSPYQGTRADFTGPSRWEFDIENDENRRIGGEFDQQGYLDAQFGNINDYLSKMGSFFSNMGPQQSASAQQILANAPGQGPRPLMPTVGSNLNLGGSTGGTNINNPFPSFGIGANAGWGTPPTSLFGAGANATYT